MQEYVSVRLAPMWQLCYLAVVMELPDWMNCISEFGVILLEVLPKKTLCHPHQEYNSDKLELVNYWLNNTVLKIFFNNTPRYSAGQGLICDRFM